MTFAQLHTSKSTVTDSFFSGQLSPLLSPADPSAIPVPPRPIPDPVVARLSSSGTHAGSEGANVTASMGGRVWIGASEGLPAGHIVFFVLPEGIDEWALVRYVASRI